MPPLDMDMNGDNKAAYMNDDSQTAYMNDRNQTTYMNDDNQTCDNCLNTSQYIIQELDKILHTFQVHCSIYKSSRLGQYFSN